MKAPPLRQTGRSRGRRPVPSCARRARGLSRSRPRRSVASLPTRTPRKRNKPFLRLPKAPRAKVKTFESEPIVSGKAITTVNHPMPFPSTGHEPKDAFRLYVREIGQTPLLKPEEEVVLAKRIKRGDKAAREHMIKANLRLVVKIARDYENLGVPLLDLINEGNIGLMKAVDKFNPAKGAKFSTYAAWWIKQAVFRALSNQAREIRIPIHLGQRIAHLRDAMSRLQAMFGREATDEELAEELETDVSHIRHWKNSAAISATSL